MFITKVPTYRKDKTISHLAILLRRSYRKNGDVKSETIANLTHQNQEDIDAIDWALKHKKDIAKLKGMDNSIKHSKSIGAVYLILDIMKKLGIDKALGNTLQGKLAKMQVISRCINQGSRLATIRMAEQQALCEVLEIDAAITEDNLYENLAWLTEKQSSIERNLFKSRYKGKEPEIFLYDVTSSYFEGVCNELAEYGYNRDKKQGKMQVVAGLLCDEEGYPLAIRLFEGNTLDFNTVHAQVKQVAEDFGCRRVTFVGDRGMLKSKQIEELEAMDFYYITAITKPQIETLFKEAGLQMSIFDKEVKEIEHLGVRYILRRNPVRAEEIMQNRMQKKSKIESICRQQNVYLKEHKRSKPETSMRKITAKIRKLKIGSWLRVEKSQEDSRELVLIEDSDKLAVDCKFDGCYVIKSNLPEEIGKDKIHDRYKDLSKVEQGFRCMKTEELELRPWYVRTEESTRGHAFVVMLSYMVIKYLKNAWKKINLTVDEGLMHLTQLSLLEITINQKGKLYKVPEPNEQMSKLLKAANVNIPEIFPYRKANVVSKVKLHRKD
jgi:transposase